MENNVILGSHLNIIDYNSKDGKDIRKIAVGTIKFDPNYSKRKMELF